MRPIKAPKWIKVKHCVTGKIIHKTIQGAVVHAKRLESARGAYGEPRGVYQCARCGFFHCGGDRERLSIELLRRSL